MDTETMEKASKTLGTMLDYLGIEASIKAAEGENAIKLTVFSDDAGRIIGRKGASLQGLQLLLNRVISKGDREAPRIMIDVDGYQRPGRQPRERGERGERGERRGGGDGERRPRSGGGRQGGGERGMTPDKEEQLKVRALEAAKEVKRWGDPVTLPPMNAAERRVVHLAIEADAEVTTESLEPEQEGGRIKSVRIVLQQQ